MNAHIIPSFAFSAGLEFFCPDALLVKATGNVPMSVKVMPELAFLSDGSPCELAALQPMDTLVCDLAWTLTKQELELGEGIVHLSIAGNDTGGSLAGLAYVASAALPAVQVPAMSLALEQLNSAGYVLPGKGIINGCRIRTLRVCSCIPALCRASRNQAV